MLTRRTFVGMGLTAASNLSGAGRRYRAVLIGHTGQGNFGHDWDLAWKRVPSVEVVAVADPVEAGREKALKRSGALNGYADYREMIRVEKPQIVTVCMRWADRRVEILRAAAGAGAHVLMEKPFAANLPDGDAMMQAVNRAGVKVQVGHQLRTSPVLQRVKRIQEGGELGQFMEMRGRGKEDRRVGGEDLTVLGSHVLDLMRFFAGDPKWVYAHVSQDGEEMAASHVRKPTEPVGLVAGDRIAAMFAFPRGVYGYWGSSVNDGPQGKRFGLTLYFSKGVIFIDLSSGRTGQAHVLRSPSWTGAGPDARWEALPPGERDQEDGWDRPNHTMAVDLIQAIEENREPACSARDGLWTIEMIAGIYRSQKVRARVEFPLAERSDPLA